ncbi:hypothetical protein E2562_015303 [Oryza meyeriana var. granulata]|uniref:Phytosulfokine n=1 Tax=Oryza meyeriana var. granulata TaxID=110450 RepID=A0A6G1DJM1_9ORYZ|nr:hypothetical protein E2562_015303 [Oryza meyeriana var. granulata]
MASSSKLAALLLMAILLCLICTRSQAARPEPESSDHKSQGAASTIAHQKSGASSGIGVEMHQEEPEAMECQGGEAEEECLMRRTLVAHTDYIYTQGNHN